MQPARSAGPEATATGTRSSPGQSRRLSRGYAEAAAGSLVALIVALAVQRRLGLDDVSPVFLLAVLVVASRTSTGPAVAAAVLCFLGYNYFFFEPRYTLYISGPRDVATIGLFLAAALLSGRLASRLAMQLSALRSANRQVRLRQQLGQRLAAAADETQVVSATEEFFAESYGVVARIDPGAPEDNPAAPPAWRIDLASPHAHAGALVLAWPGDRCDEGDRSSIEAMATDIAQALLRARLVADLESTRIANETERLRSALLASVSHDLRTPLAGMLGAAETLESYGAAMDAADRSALLATIREEGRRLDRHIENLLDMTRLGRGGLTLRRDWIGIDELIGSAIGRLRRFQPDIRLVAQVDADIGPIWVHPALVEQALFNVIENAAKFSPPDAAIDVRAQRSAPDALFIDVHDRGPGIPAAERERIFEMFYSMGRGDRGQQGTGLGLSICRGMIAAHGGSVEALPCVAGTTIRITLPLRTPETGATS